MQLEEAIKCSTSFTNAAKLLGTNRKAVKQQTIENGIDYSHFICCQKSELMIDNKYGMLTVKSIRRTSKRSFALCLCDCGKEKEFRCDGVKSGRIISCGCHSMNRWNTVAASNHAFTGCGELRGSYYYELQLNAKKRKLEFAISIEELWDIFQKQKGKCALTGTPLKFGRIYYRNETTASPDRIDNAKGYVPGNIQWVLKDINMIRGGYDREYFINLCNLVASNHPRNFVYCPPDPVKHDRRKFSSGIGKTSKK